jgi:hypothetical protein
MYLITNVPRLSVYVRNEFLYDFTRTGFTKALLLTAKSPRLHAIWFQVLTEHGALFDKIPIHALCTHEFSAPMELDDLQLWDCPSYHFTSFQIDYLKNKRAKVFLKSGEYFGRYMFSLDWGADQVGADLSLAEDWPEHKSAHILLLENGNFAAQPNNRILWHDPSWIKNPQKPEYRVCSKDYRVENKTWSLKSEDEYFYTTDKEK